MQGFFSKIGIIRDNPIRWFKRNSLLLSKETHTGLDFWLNQTLREFNSWIVEYNTLIQEQEKEQG